MRTRSGCFLAWLMAFGLLVAGVASEVEATPTGQPFKPLVSHSVRGLTQGEPAILRVGESYPVITLEAFQGPGAVTATLVCNGSELANMTPLRVVADERVKIAFDGVIEKPGMYEIQVVLTDNEDRPAYFTTYFMAVESDQAEMQALQAAFLDPDGRLQYAPDYLGNRIPDFSNAGYGGGGVPIPDVPVVQVLEPTEEGDDTQRIQAAIDAVASLPIDENGFRGAVLLKRGTYRVSGSIHITHSGIVLRGEGDGIDGTILIATGDQARTLIRLEGAQGASVVQGSAQAITDLYVPVGAHTFHVADASGFAVGDTIIVRRYGNAEWITEIGMDQLPTDKPGIRQWQPFHLDFERVIVDVTGNTITVDAPIMAAIDSQWGGGEVYRVVDERIEQVGVENIRAVSEHNPGVRCHFVLSCDENHATYLLSFDQVKNAWAQQLTAVNFMHGMVHIERGAKWITVQDTRSLDPISRIEGSRRYPYHVRGQLILVQRAYTNQARHAYALNTHVTGPNVFLYTRSDDNYAFSEPHQHWAAGGLYDNVVSWIAVQDRYTYGSGHGWSGANFVAWNTEGKLIIQKPPTAQNWAIGHVGERLEGDFLPRTQGYWVSHGQHVQPPSLYLQQLKDRLGTQALANIGYPLGPDRSHIPGPSN